jgi:hypothetical protein
VLLPLWLVEAIEMTCPLEDRTPDRRVFQGCHVMPLNELSAADLTALLT